MTTIIPPNISDYTARNISLKQLRLWSESGDGHKQELIKLLKEIRGKLARGASPSKVITFATKSLEAFYSKKEVRGEVQLLNNRHIVFKLMFPGVNDQDLQFCLVYGEINGRTKACKFDETTPIKISAHALQRLLARLDVSSDSKALDELYSCIKLAIPWHQAASETDAQCWPLMSEHGFFVGAPSPDSLVTTLITWMKADGLSKKWLEPLENLWRLKSKKPRTLEDPVFAQEFLISFPWMLKEHVPGLDLPSLAWESKDLDRKNDPISHENTDDLMEQDVEDNQEITTYKKRSVSYLSGLNYSNTPPPLKIYDQIKGLVVQKRADGNIIVGLKNGWVGKIPKISIEKGSRLIENYIEPEIGDEIAVSIQKIKRWIDEDAFLISLDPVDISDAHWAEIEKLIPINSQVFGKISVDLKNKFGVQLSDGHRGLIDKTDVITYLQATNNTDINLFNLELEFNVIGFNAPKKNLLLSIPNLIELHKTSIIEKIQIGKTYHGTCIRFCNNFSQIQLDNGYTGVLHRNNSWGLPLPNVGDSVEVNSIYLDPTENEIWLSRIHEKLISEYFNCLPVTDTLWNSFVNNHSEGDIVEVQVKDWIEGSQGFIVATRCGMRGLMSKKEFTWYELGTTQDITLGDIFTVKITKINNLKRKVAFSKKMAEPHALDDPKVLSHKGEVFSGQITSIVDYGYFIAIPQLKADGLLHKSKIPEGVSFSKNELIKVSIADIDLQKKRISLSLAQENQDRNISKI
ncbi:30S ribosomal protein S1 [Polynucleobacter paneuropaeus]|nr:30S ribosomal protein S1 [Polynucleobacter paneuropaeus]